MEKYQNGQKIFCLDENKMCFYNDGSLIEEETKDALLEMIPDSFFARGEFEILSEEDKEIDIQEMQEVNLFSNGVNSSEDTRKKCYDNNFVIIEETLNELQKAIKQLDKKIKE